jgi:nucleotide-binding universal stress UspA family protein
MEPEIESPIRIVLPLDGSSLAEQAIGFAQTLADGSGEIALLRVLLPARPVRGLLGDVIVSAEGVLSRMRADAKAELGAIACRLRQDSPEITTTVNVCVGDPAEEIIRLARERNADLIVMASHGRGAVGRLAFGSVADRVARTSETPVMIIRPQAARPELGPVSIYRLLVPLDGSDIAAQALPLAEAIGKWLDVPIHLLAALDISQATSYSLATGALFSEPLYDEVFGRLRHDTEQMLEQQAEQLRQSGISAEWEIVEGQAVPTIENAARDGDVVVMTTHGRGGVGRWVIGSVAEKLVRHCPAPVILLRAKATAEGGESAMERDSSAATSTA